MSQRQVSKSCQDEKFDEKLAKSHELVSGMSISSHSLETNTILVLDSFGKISQIEESEDGTVDISVTEVEQLDDPPKLPKDILQKPPAVEGLSSGETIKLEGFTEVSGGTKDIYHVVDGSELERLDDEETYVLNSEKAKEVVIGISDGYGERLNLTKQFDDESEVEEFQETLDTAKDLELNISEDGFTIEGETGDRRKHRLGILTLIASMGSMVLIPYVVSLIVATVPFVQSIPNLASWGHLLTLFLVIYVSGGIAEYGENLLEEGRVEDVTVSELTQVADEGLYEIDEFQSVNVEKREIVVLVEEDEITLKADDIEWTFDAYDGYPLQEALDVFNNLGYENVYNDDISGKIVKKSNNADVDWSNGYRSDCGNWYLFSDDEVIDT